MIIDRNHMSLIMKKHIAVLIVSVLCLSLAAISWAETGPTPVTAINNFTINVSDPARSLSWYQGLFDLPIVARQGNTVVMRIGDGPQFMAINGTASQKPGYSHYGLSVDNFSAWYRIHSRPRLPRRQRRPHLKKRSQ